MRMNHRDVCMVDDKDIPTSYIFYFIAAIVIVGFSSTGRTPLLVSLDSKQPATRSLVTASAGAVAFTDFRMQFLIWVR